MSLTVDMRERIIRVHYALLGEKSGEALRLTGEKND